MNILVRLPNWLGDVVMSVPFIRSLQQLYPQANIDIITKKGLDELIGFIPEVRQVFPFSKEENAGLKGVYRFGKMLKKQSRYDLFFCLPDSFSSAIMGAATGSKKRIGFSKEGRGFLLTNSYTRPKGLHRVEEFVSLLQQFTGQPIIPGSVSIPFKAAKVPNRIIINMNSEAESRRMPVAKAISIINKLRTAFTGEMIFIGAKKEIPHVSAIVSGLNFSHNLQNVAGKTSLSELCELMSSAELVLSTDSGPAHLSNALGKYTIVLQGAGDENNTHPYDQENYTIIRLGELPCEPCVKNICQFGLPKCMLLLDEDRIVQTVMASLPTA